MLRYFSYTLRLKWQDLSRTSLCSVSLMVNAVMRCELLCFYLEWAPNWNSVPRSCQYIKSAYCGALKRPEKNEWSCAARHPRIFWIMRPYNVPNNNPSSQWAGNNINEFYCRFEKPFHRLHLNRSPPLFCTTFPPALTINEDEECQVFIREKPEEVFLSCQAADLCICKTHQLN